MTGKDFKSEPIAVVGIGCRFSGSATNPAALWDMLSKGSTGWTKTASHRFNLNAFWHPNGDNKGTVGLREQKQQGRPRPLTSDLSIVQRQRLPSPQTRPSLV